MMYQQQAIYMDLKAALTLSCRNSEYQKQAVDQQQQLNFNKKLLTM